PSTKCVKCLFSGCKTDYIWCGSTSNMLGHLRNTHHITKSSLNSQTAEEIIETSKQNNLPEPYNKIQ
ncbi:8407_t:CDS:1, partial [Racocetra persica]